MRLSRFLAGLDQELQIKCYERGVKTFKEAFQVATQAERARTAAKLVQPVSCSFKVLPFVDVSAIFKAFIRHVWHHESGLWTYVCSSPEVIIHHIDSHTTQTLYPGLHFPSTIPSAWTFAGVYRLPLLSNPMDFVCWSLTHAWPINTLCPASFMSVCCVLTHACFWPCSWIKPCRWIRCFLCSLCTECNRTCSFNLT